MGFMSGMMTPDRCIGLLVWSEEHGHSHVTSEDGRPGVPEQVSTRTCTPLSGQKKGRQSRPKEGYQEILMPWPDQGDPAEAVE